MTHKITKITTTFGLMVATVSLSSFSFIPTAIAQTSSPVIVSASVAETVSCSASSGTEGLSTLTISSINTVNSTSTLSCNAAGGCGVSVTSANAALVRDNTDTLGAYSITSADATLVAGTEGYGIKATTTANGSGGTLTVNAKYNVTGNTVGALLLAGNALVESSVPVSNREALITYQAAISGLTKSGAYSDTITYECTGV